MPDPPTSPGPLPVPALPLVRGTVGDERCRVTLLIGVALDVLAAHAAGRLVGPVHPRSLVVSATGRPGITVGDAPPGWTEDDDVTAVLRLGRALGLRVPSRDLRAAVEQLARDGDARALPELRPPVPSVPRRRWWGRAR
jgi:hypothetical protein